MSRLIGGLALLLMVGGSGTSAHAGSWCVFYDFSTYNCGFHSYQQCYATAFGNGGWCRPNYFEDAPRPGGKKARSRY
jgi:Protein of unknown function (DUF3551)